MGTTESRNTCHACGSRRYHGYRPHALRGFQIHSCFMSSLLWPRGRCMLARVRPRMFVFQLVAPKSVWRFACRQPTAIWPADSTTATARATPWALGRWGLTSPPVADRRHITLAASGCYSKMFEHRFFARASRSRDFGVSRGARLASKHLGTRSTSNRSISS